MPHTHTHKEGSVSMTLLQFLSRFSPMYSSCTPQNTHTPTPCLSCFFWRTHTHTQILNDCRVNYISNACSVCSQSLEIQQPHKCTFPQHYQNHCLCFFWEIKHLLLHDVTLNYFYTETKWKRNSCIVQPQRGDYLLPCCWTILPRLNGFPTSLNALAAC